MNECASTAGEPEWEEDHCPPIFLVRDGAARTDVMRYEASRICIQGLGS